MSDLIGNHLWPITAKPQQYPACMAMAPTTAVLWAILSAARARQIADPASPEHWLHHIDPVTLEHSKCECEAAREDDPDEVCGKCWTIHTGECL